MNWQRHRGMLWAFCLGLYLCGFLSIASGEEKPKPKPARFSVSGYGLLGNRELKQMVRSLELGKSKPEFLGAAFIEDAALLLTSRVKRDGYLKPTITVRLRLANGERRKLPAEELEANPLPRPLQIVEVDFHIDGGQRYHFERIEFTGLEVISRKQALSYFVETDTLLKTAGTRIYTTDRLKRGLGSLVEVLERRGYPEAKAEVTHQEQDDTTGGVRVHIRVREGPLNIVHSVRKEVHRETQPAAVTNSFVGRPYSKLWLQDFSLSLKRDLYREGYPDATATTRIAARDQQEDHVELDLEAKVESGPKVMAGNIQFKGQQHTSTDFMARRIPVQPGQPLNRLQAEKGRSNLAELGIFDSVRLSYDNVDEHVRDLIYEVDEGTRLNLSTLFGWGSYEMLRGGLIVDAYNIWGRAHHARIKAIQSLRSSRGEFTYTIPAYLGREVDLFFHGAGLRREEVDFTRQEYGGGMGVHKFFQEIGTDVTVRYNYEILQALHTIPGVASEGLISPAVGSIIADFKHDRRDNPLYPRRGYKVFLTLESASEYLGGEANYERVEISPSWHLRLGGGRFLSLGASHGVVISHGGIAENLPFNRRFFPGGDHSIRGYQEGEASPRNEERRFVGAETYTLGTVELEQALTPKWALVGFTDALGIARRLGDYPFDTGLFSVGGGIRWRTIIGPVRLEYAHNLNPRSGDPDWTIHFSLGFPF